MNLEHPRRLITLSCPECSHVQTEPSLVISTNCRSCGQHFSVEDEKPVERMRYAARLASSKSPALEYPAVAPATVRLLERRTVERSFLRRFFVKQGARQALDCYHCAHEFEAVAEAQSTQCPKCGGYVSLRDHEISNHCQKRIQTRGQVRILKGGSLSSGRLDCRDLIVLGSLSAPVVCSGKMIIRSHGKIPHDVRCKELRVERGAKVELQGEVFTASVSIDGQVKANINCEGTIVLEKRAQLQGVVRAVGMVAKAGAKHSGLLEVIEPRADV